jgi:dipeptidyl aminopeptidase/acylaminoacyl peptidase
MRWGSRGKGSSAYFHSCFVSVAPTSLPEFFKETSLPTPVQLELKGYFGNRSPITHAREIAQTDKRIGLLYDRDDQIVPENQGTMMHNALGEEGGNVKSHVSEGYGHGMILYPKNQKVLVKWLLERE